MLTSLVILGAGGFARETLDVVDAINEVSPTWDVLGFVVERQYAHAGTIVNDKPILGDFEWLEQYRGIHIICGVGASQVRRKLILRLRGGYFKFATLVHPSVIQTRWIKLGQGVVITAGCVLGNLIEIGDHVVINPGCIVGHDVTVNSFASVGPGALISGNVQILEGAYIGTGTKIIEKKTIGAWSTIGAGATVIRDVPANATVVGVPARVIKQRQAGWHLV